MIRYLHSEKKRNQRNGRKRWVTLLLVVSLLAAPVQTDAASYQEMADQRKAEEVQSNTVKKWPQGPAIGAQAAVLMDADTGAILYAKNMHEQLYPASVTKIMTGLLAIENSSMDEVLKFSHNAVYSVPWDGCQMGMSEGEKITMEECLGGMLCHSANEAANGVAEHIGGSIEGFAQMMNEKAVELGCTDSNFKNPSGLFEENHYTSAHDLALIAQAFFSYDTLCTMASQYSYTVKSTNVRPDGFTVYSKNKFFNGQMPYEYVIGSKTGYTNEARQTLVTCARKDGQTLVCVILKEESPNQFQDTIDLFNYGFEHFSNCEVEEDGELYEACASKFLDASSMQEMQIVEDHAVITLPEGIELSKVNVSYQADLEEENETGEVKSVIEKEQTADEENADQKESRNEQKMVSAGTTSGILTYTYQGVTLGSIRVTGQGISIPQPEKEEETPARIQDKEIPVWSFVLVGVILVAAGAGVIIYKEKKRR